MLFILMPAYLADNTLSATIKHVVVPGLSVTAKHVLVPRLSITFKHVVVARLLNKPIK